MFKQWNRFHVHEFGIYTRFNTLKGHMLKHTYHHYPRQRKQHLSNIPNCSSNKVVMFVDVCNPLNFHEPLILLFAILLIKEIMF